MIFRSKKEAIYNSCDPEQISSILYELRKEKITTYVKNKNLASTSMISFGGAMTTEQMKVIKRVLYTIYVREKDVEFARSILTQYRNRMEQQ